MTAAIAGPLSGHTLAWLQTSGLAATITTIDDLTIEFVSDLPAPGSREFRFVVDEGTVNEQFVDVLVRQVINATVPLSGLVATFDLNAVTALAGIDVAVTGVDGTFDINTPVVIVDDSFALTGVSGTFDFGAPVIVVDATLTLAGGVTATFALGAPTPIVS